ncbi:hypothetical protein [Frigoriglobus tundricola]|uniref:Uncharacterized protein n=1 Tax=Frigoriglobus tundricola TaxID=2774151 RepID=A0A6M5YWD0_9BACT|nr:hypothetical protein [Frigoriglobus tundricola]QJW98335.1 hypothetical protein FTUN_5923 [Frigoriglobus tundricola]
MRCRWPLFALAHVLAVTFAATAQPPIEPKDGKYVVPLTVDAVAPVRPALKYRLLPDIREVQSGNQVQAFYKCFFEQNHLFHSKESTDKQQKWRAAPLKDLAQEKELVNYGGAAVKQAYYAARLDTVDWQLLNQMRSDGTGLLLPDVQQMRMLATVLTVRVRGEIARGEFDAALQTLQTMFALARTFNEQPTLIGHLVGAALAMIALGEVEEFVQQPGAPNLFWALTDLPAPFIDLRKGVHVEKLLVTKEYDGLQKAVPIPEDALGALIKSLDTLLGPDRKADARPSAWYAKQAGDPAAVAAATERLSGFGHKPADLAKLSPLQLIVMDDRAQYEADMDEFAKWTNVPFWQIPPELVLPKPRPGAFAQLLPVFNKVLHAKVRVHQTVAQLTASEGVRAYAADNRGQLPIALDAVKLPVPADPMTGKPFVYELKDGRALIRGTPPRGLETWPTYNRVYAVTVRK